MAARDLPPTIDHLITRAFYARRLRSCVFGEHVDDFAAWLEADGYARRTIGHALQGTFHLAAWLRRRRRDIAMLDEVQLDRFVATASATRFTRRVWRTGIGHLLRFLRSKGIVRESERRGDDPDPMLIHFEQWMEVHRGLRPSTVVTYAPTVKALLTSVRGDLSKLTAQRLRAFVLARASKYGPGSAGVIVQATRAFVRFLVVEERCPAEMLGAVPTLASWKGTTLPRYLAASDVERVIRSCDRTHPEGIRDAAVVLLLARLGLRAGDVAALHLDEIDWRGGRIRVSGKSRREDWLPLPQEVGDALMAYIEKSRLPASTPHVFLNVRAPRVPLTRKSVSKIVRRAIERAGVQAPSRGAHVLRHSLATTMLRRGASLGEISLMLRQASIETTLRYAKVDTTLLSAIAAPWPEALAVTRRSLRARATNGSARRGTAGE